MLNFRDLMAFEPLYTFVDNSGVNTHIASGRLYKWVSDNRDTLESQIFDVPVDHALARGFLANNVISKERLIELLTREIANLSPIIFAKDGSYTEGRPDVFLVDGHHRYVVYAVKQLPLIPAYLLEVEQWKPFQVLNAPTMSQAELAAAPHLRRTY